MNIGIIGAGNIGSNAAKLFAAAGHDVAISNSRGAASLAEIAKEIGATAADRDDAIVFGDVVLVSIPLGKYKTLPPNAFAGKIVIDSNNYYPNRDGNIPDLDERKTTSSQMLSEHLKDARVVKAFNTIWSEHLRTEGDPAKPLDERRVIFLSGDDAEAKSVVSNLIEEIGFTPYDLGGLAESSLQQPDSPIYNKSVTTAEARQILSDEQSAGRAAS